jgi:hypothetical protein
MKNAGIVEFRCFLRTGSILVRLFSDDKAHLYGNQSIALLD